MSTSNLFVNAVKSTQQIIPDVFSRRKRTTQTLDKPKRSTGPVTVGKIISELQPLPAHSMLLGQCLDGLPFLMRLEDPAMGAILISCEPGAGKTHQLQVMVHSAIQANAPHELQVSILTHRPNEWNDLAKDVRKNKYLFKLQAWYQDGAEALIKDLTHLAESRREAEDQGAAVLFVLDDFNFVEELSYEAQVNLHWLLAYGAQSGVWVVAAIKSGYAISFRYWLETFRTRIIGRVLSKENAEILSARPDSWANGLNSGVFRIRSGEDWLTYRLPLLGG